MFGGGAICDAAAEPAHPPFNPRPSSPAALLALLLTASLAAAQFESLSSGFSFGDDDAKAASPPPPPPSKKPAAKPPADAAPADPPTPKPRAAAAKRAAAPAPAAEKEEPPVPAPAPAPTPAAAAKKATAASDKPADLAYTLFAKRATYDPTTKVLTLETVSPQVAAVKGGTEARRGTAAALLSGPSFVKRGAWLGGASALLTGTSGAVTRGLVFDLASPKWDAAAAKATFEAAQVPPTGGAPAVGGGVAEGAAKSGKGSAATSKVTLNDVVLMVDAVY